MATVHAGDDDQALVEGWRRGDSGSAGRIVLRHGPAMTRVALALCSRAEDAEEAVQEALFLAHRRLDRYDARKGSLRTWLLGITANRARQLRRGLARYAGFLSRLRREPYGVSESPAISADLAFARGRLASLPQREREAFVLVEIEGLTSREAAAVMRIAGPTVRVLVSRARRRLREVPRGEPVCALREEGRRS